MMRDELNANEDSIYCVLGAKDADCIEFHSELEYTRASSA
jgi:hypothetical protein